MSWKFAILLPTVAFSTVVRSAPLEGYVSYSSVARARHSSDILYGERHVLKYREGRVAERVVLYTCRDGSAFARKLVSYSNLLAPDFLLEDAGNGMREGIRDSSGDRSTNARRTVFYRERGGETEKSAAVPEVEGLVADAGFDEFVQTHWDALVSGRTLDMRFLLPSRLEDYGFQVQRLRTEFIEGESAEAFQLRLSGIWGRFLPGIDVLYRSADHVLLRYEGLSDLHDSAGNNYETTIEFHAEPAAASAQVMQEARQTPIAPCR